MERNSLRHDLHESQQRNIQFESFVCLKKLFLILFFYISLRVAIKCRNNYTKLVAIGCVTLLICQSIIHIAVATGMMPTTGLPLPFVSYGGNSLISSFFINAMLLRCSLESTGYIGIISARKSLN